jgi:hypothetical protein
MHSSKVNGPKRPFPFSSVDHRPSQLKRSARFDELVGKFSKEPHALTELDLNELVCECMFHGDVESLRGIFEARALHELDIPRHAGEDAWWTLLSALPECCSINRLILQDHYFDDVTGALLLTALGQMPELKSLRLLDCTFRDVVWKLSCPPLPQLQDLHVEKTQKPFPLLQAILDPAVSQLSKLHLVDDHGMDHKDHVVLAKMLGAQGKLRDLALREWPAPEKFENLLKYYVEFLRMATTTLTHLDLSWNPLREKSCVLLSKALKDKTTLISLTLAGCWRDEIADRIKWGYVKPMVTLGRCPPRSFLHQFPWTCAAEILMELGHTEKLRHLDFYMAKMEGIGLEMLALRLRKLKLTSLRLPFMLDAHCVRFFDVMKSNRSLRFLNIGNFERSRPLMTEDEFHRRYENHLALMTFVDGNQREWNETVLPRGMAVLLGHMGRVDPAQDPAPRQVFLEIARYAAQWALAIDEKHARVLTLLNKDSRGEKN